jgi:O-antigen ligase
MSRRVSMGRSAVQMFLDHPIKGVGLGALVAAYPRYETVYDGDVVEHVHNDYLEALAETGIVGGICGLMFLFLLYRDAREAFDSSQGHFSRALHAGAIAAVGGLLLHSFIDFNLHIPSNAFLFLVQVSLATSSALPSRSARADAARYVRRETAAVAATPA